MARFFLTDVAGVRLLASASPAALSLLRCWTNSERNEMAQATRNAVLNVNFPSSSSERERHTSHVFDTKPKRPLDVDLPQRVLGVLDNRLGMDAAHNGNANGEADEAKNAGKDNLLAEREARVPEDTDGKDNDCERH